eukprot:GILK01007547.1.p1 GENE.GILK01007547.1~~GILK01007547.1.p1  ORF type:complete len:523 (-),score=80.31 GILK01007547.1:38-1570(-)
MADDRSKKAEGDRQRGPRDDRELRARLLEHMCSSGFEYPVDSKSLLRVLLRPFQKRGVLIRRSVYHIDDILKELAERGAIDLGTLVVGSEQRPFITEVYPRKVEQLSREAIKDRPKASKKRGRDDTDEPANIFRGLEDPMGLWQSAASNRISHHKKKRTHVDNNVDDIENLLVKPSARQKETMQSSQEIASLLNRASAKEQSIVEKFRSRGGTQLKEFCPHGTKEECRREHRQPAACDKVHFVRVIKQHTDVALGDCSYLDTCRHMETCRFVHYQIDNSDSRKLQSKEGNSVPVSARLPPQWINCDLRFLDFTVLGHFDVVMADPPWDIHMDLPYGTMKDDEMRTLRVDQLQTDGVIFLWVTGRAMELARECLDLWGYKRVDELIWVKTNQLQRIIRTGRTGHWLNHSKEHCLVGIKGNPKINRLLDCDVLLSEVRETSRKPDEVYDLIERMHPNGRKIELFGRSHNRHHNWVTLGNQLPGVHLVEHDVITRWNQANPEHALPFPDVQEQ